ncbi:hypothetical protein NDU88_000063 [Pleurodeles waltl]|uniref:Uncharacterized protein n=1 Tax=Pleurodeles waltl TaxID=8319 RepID=A0AAV7P4J8_PLEWA|nr:hypothetical protein NDU88_000063 [Pleurodeles waltl]
MSRDSDARAAGGIRFHPGSVPLSGMCSPGLSCVKCPETALAAGGPGVRLLPSLPWDSALLEAGSDCWCCDMTAGTALLEARIDY